MNAEWIIEVVAEAFDVPVEDIVSDSKIRPVSTARSVAMYAIRKLTDLSYPAIGRLFDRDHTTVMNSVKKIETLIGAEGYQDTYDRIFQLAASVQEAEANAAPTVPSTITYTVTVDRADAEERKSWCMSDGSGYRLGPSNPVTPLGRIERAQDEALIAALEGE